MVSHRSGETEDTTIADLVGKQNAFFHIFDAPTRFLTLFFVFCFSPGSVALGVGQVKTIPRVLVAHSASNVKRLHQFAAEKTYRCCMLWLYTLSFVSLLRVSLKKLDEYSYRSAG